jgi:iron complex transport system ATP-binding protein
MASDRSGIDVRAVCFRYDARRVLHEVDLAVGPGEIVGLLGPNGSGKSTLVGLLSGVLAAESGSIRVGDAELGTLDRRTLARRIAVVPQEMGFGFPFSALEVVLMGRHPHLAGLTFESDADLALAREALARCGAQELGARPITELSSGERQRVVFAKALAQQAPLLLLDEPASFLDVRHQVELYDIVRELVERRGTGVLTVMHDLNLAAEYCDRIYLLREGRIEAHGPTAEVLTYANLTRVFGTDLYVDVNAVTGRLLIVPLSGRVQRRLREEGGAPDSS